jgi:copper(I)-binding protein
MFRGVAQAADFTAGNLQIGNPWTRATPKGSTVAGGYMVITNKGSTPDRLTGGSVSVANRFEIHRMAMEGGVMTMRPVEGGLEIKPGESVELKPGSFHVMLMGLKQPLEKGQRIKGTLEFEKAGKVDIEYAVEAIGATPAAKGGHHH